MRDEQVGEAEPLLQIEQQVHDLRLHGDVERRDRLVGDDERRLERERARDADALPLAAAELVRVLVDVGGVEPDELEQLPHARATLLARADLVNDERLLDDRADAHPRIQRRVRILEDDLEVPARAAQFAGRELPDVQLLEPDLARRRLDQPQHAPPGRRLAAPGLADEAERLAGRDGEAHVVDGPHRRRLAEQRPARRKLLDEVLDLDERRHEVFTVPACSGRVQIAAH